MDFDPEADRYRDLPDAIRLVQQEEDFPEGVVERFEVVCHASGDVTWRVWPPRAEDPIGGHIMSEPPA